MCTMKLMMWMMWMMYLFPFRTILIESDRFNVSSAEPNILLLSCSSKRVFRLFYDYSCCCWRSCRCFILDLIFCKLQTLARCALYCAVDFVCSLSFALPPPSLSPPQFLYFYLVLSASPTTIQSFDAYKCSFQIIANYSICSQFKQQIFQLFSVVVGCLLFVHLFVFTLSSFLIPTSSLSCLWYSRFLLIRLNSERWTTGRNSPTRIKARSTKKKKPPSLPPTAIPSQMKCVRLGFAKRAKNNRLIYVRVFIKSDNQLAEARNTKL